MSEKNYANQLHLDEPCQKRSSVDYTKETFSCSIKFGQHCFPNFVAIRPILPTTYQHFATFFGVQQARFA